MAISASFDSLDLAGKNVLIRLDLNVPMHQGKILSDARIAASLGVIEQCLSRGAKCAVMAHLGRPQGRRDPAYSLLPVAQRLGVLCGREVLLADSCVGDGVVGLMRGLGPRQLVCLENLRFHAGEEQNDSTFAKELAKPFDVYINDAFGAAHRAHASIVGIVGHIRESAMGPWMLRECQTLLGLREHAKKPFVGVFGGAKVADKVGAILGLLGRADTLLIGGAMAYTFLVAAGASVGQSRVDSRGLSVAKEVLERAKARNTRILLPLDHISAHSIEEDAVPMLIPTQNLPEDVVGLDIGPVTRAAFADQIRHAESIFWNGPMGVFEREPYASGTKAIAEAVAQCPGQTVVGGGDSLAALEQARLSDKIDFLSTGGGAALELLEQGTLPGIEVLGRME